MEKYDADAAKNVQNGQEKPTYPGAIETNPMFDESELITRRRNQEPDPEEKEIPVENDISDTSYDGQNERTLSDEADPVSEKGTPDPGEAVKLSELTKSGDKYAAGYLLIGENPNNPRERNKGLFKREESLIMRFVDKTVANIYEKIRNGVIGQFFTSYESFEKKTERSVILSFPKKIASFFERRRNLKIKKETVVDDITGEAVAVVCDKTSQKHSPLRRAVKALENSKIIDSVSNFLSNLLYMPMSAYGALFLAMGITTVLIQAARLLLFADGFDIIGVIVGVVYTLLAMITIFAGDAPLVKYLCESKIGSFLLTSVFGVSKKNIDLTKSVQRHRFWAFLVGVALGFLSAAVSAFDIFLALVAIVFALGVAYNPESGVLITLFALPFAPLVSGGSKYLCIAIFYIALVWTVKIIRGQRRIKLGPVDIWLALFAVFVLITAFVSVNRDEALVHAIKIIMPMLGFFMCANLFSLQVWMRRGVNAIILSGFIVSSFEIYEWIKNALEVSWNFDKILSAEISSVFDSAEVLSIYLVMVFFFALSGVTSSKEKGEKLFSGITLLTTLAGTILTMNLYAYVALVIGVMIYLLMRSKKNAASVFGLLVVILLVLSTVSDVVPSYLTGLAGNAFGDNLDNLRVTMQMASNYAPCGIGLGESVFENIYESLAEPGMSVVSYSGNLLLEMVIRFGMIGLVFVAAAAVMLYRQAFSSHRNMMSKGYAISQSIAAVSSITAALMLSGVCYIWSDLSVSVLFWALAGFIPATKQISLFENRESSHESELSINIPIKSFNKTVISSDQNANPKG